MENELISRKAAIDAIWNSYGSASAVKNIENLPSAQPEPCEDSVSRDSVSKWLDRWEGYIDKDMINRMQYKVCDIPSVKPDIPTVDTPTVVPTCEDTISRQDAIRIVDGIDTWQAGWRGDAIESMKALPSAQPDLDDVYAHAETEAEARFHAERKKGRWIPQDHNKTNGMMSTLVYYYPKCSVCGHCANYTNFCPNCGADMREPEDIPMEYFESGGR